jgi:hypothetical protein
MCAFVLWNRWPKLNRLTPFLPIASVILILIAPSYFRLRFAGAPRPLADAYHHLRPFEQSIQAPGAALISRGFSPELCNYFGALESCTPLDFRDLRRQVTSDTKWDQVLQASGATIFYADPAVLSDAAGWDFVANAESYGWRLAGAPGETWAVFERGSGSSNAAILNLDRGYAFGEGWYDPEFARGGEFRWVSNDAELVVRQPSLALEIEPGPSLAGKPLLLQILDDSQIIQTETIAARGTIMIKIPRGAATIRLHAESPNQPIPGDSRILNFRVFKIVPSLQ